MRVLLTLPPLLLGLWAPLPVSSDMLPMKMLID
jgi:hypothetical protein